MARQWTLYAYSSCSSCTQAAAWLRRHNIDFRIVPIYQEPPAREEIEAMASRLEGGVHELVGTRSNKFRELGLKGKELSDSEWVDWLVKEPRLLRRPILTDGEKVIVGFSESRYADAFA